ncbi:enoyl-CoA hydratase/isomerase family protein [Nocardia sp. NPDC059177]|uniref:enoyl-CoA hydratase/isomerase family protein n=1 Tax=Nocardia sp. NPDC059177 TaxID=3346759 RepID=UPI0036C7D403
MATLVLNRPSRRNTLEPAVLDGLVRHTSTLLEQGDVRAVVVTGAGRDFCLGGSLDDLDRSVAGDPSDATAEYTRLTDALATVVLNLTALPCPVIAAVNGQAAGAGFSLALACDLRIAGRSTRLNFAYGALGAATDGGMTWQLPRIVGQARSLELLFEQPVIRAPQALAEGLVTAVVPDADVLDRARQRALRLAEGPPNALASAKRLVRSGWTESLTTHLQHEHAAFLAALHSGDVARGLAARRNGDVPCFDGA